MRVLDERRHPGAAIQWRTTMNWKLSNARVASRMAAAVGLAGILLLTSRSVGLAQSNSGSSRSRLEGTWLVQVTLRNCATNAPLGSFNSLVTAHQGGTMSETTSSPAFAIGQRSPGHAAWISKGRHTYGQQMISLINFDTPANLPGAPGFDPSAPVSPGFFAGWATVSHTIELTDEDHGTSSGTNDFYKADGTKYRSGCSTAVMRRFE
jgi:hypothetical protein